MKSHVKISELLADFVLDELPEEQESAVKTHIAQCQKCVSELKKLQALLECTKQISDLSVDENVCESAKQAILEIADKDEGKNQNAQTNITWLRLAGITAIAASLIIFFSLLLINILSKNRTVETDISVVHTFRENRYKVTERGTSPLYILLEAQNNRSKETKPCDILPQLLN